MNKIVFHKSHGKSTAFIANTLPLIGRICVKIDTPTELFLCQQVFAVVEDVLAALRLVAVSRADGATLEGQVLREFQH